MSSVPSHTNNPWFTVSVGLIGVIVGFGISSAMHGFTFVPHAAQPIAQQPPAAAAAGTASVPSNDKPATVGEGMVLGKADAPVTLIEFSDFQCPYCRRWYRDTYATLKKTYIDTGKVKLVYRHFPLPMHTAAEPSAIAVECAQQQSDALGWSFHDTIFAMQDKSGNMGTFQYGAPELSEWAKSIPGLNQATWKDCFDGKKSLPGVKKDQSDGSLAGISGTPGFWLLGPKNQSKKISGAVPFATFQTAIEAMLKA